MMNIYIKVAISFPKIIWFNFRYLPITQAIKLPVFLTYNTDVRISRGGLALVNQVRPGMIRIGFHQVSSCNLNDETRLIVERGGKMIFEGTAHLGNGTKLHVYRDSHLVLGDNFSVSASSVIKAYRGIKFGRDIQFSWHCLVMDSDTHHIIDQNGKIMNEDKPIVFGNKIWIGCGTTILKGTQIPSNCVIGANSFVSGCNYEENSIIAGNPAKSIKPIGTWIL